MRIGVYPVTDRSAGGIYQYSTAILRALDGLRTEFEPVVVHDRPENLPSPSQDGASWSTLTFGPPTPRLIARRAAVTVVGDQQTRRIASIARAMAARPQPSDAPSSAQGAHPRKGAADWLRRRVDLMLYPGPTTWSFELGLPYVMAVHDLQHRLHPEFPEVSANGEADAREYLYSNGIRKAAAILVDSDIGREDVLDLYGHLTEPDRVHVLPFVSPPYLVRPDPKEVAAILERCGIRDRFLLFPAQFWPHKNHGRVTRAIAALRDEGLVVTMVMTGSSDGAIRRAVLAEVQDLAATLGIREQLKILGYVDDETMGALYAAASGVVLPTFFGPTNIPVIEGWSMDVPVLTSDIRGIREQCGDAAILVDPTSVAAIASGLRSLWVDERLRAQLVVNGRARIASYGHLEFRDRLGSVLRTVTRRGEPAYAGASA